MLGLLEAKPGKQYLLEDELRILVKLSSQEEGCINYNLHRHLTNPAAFMFYENWESTEALEKHRGSPHIKAWEAKKNELLIDSNKVSLWELMS